MSRTVAADGADWPAQEAVRDQSTSSNLAAWSAISSGLMFQAVPGPTLATMKSASRRALVCRLIHAEGCCTASDSKQ